MEQPVIDYLTKQVQIDRNVVTFRSLSRQFNLHVNAAKNNLAAFHAASRNSSDPVYATYMLTGELARPKEPPSQSQQDKMEVDSDGPDGPAASGEERQAEEPDSEVVPLTKVLLVGENDVEQAKAQYTRLFSQFVYSVSPAHLIDSSLICAPSEKVYEVDAKLKADASTLLGRLVGPHVHTGKPIALAPLPTKSVVTLAISPEPKQAATVKSEKQEDKPKLRPKDNSKPALKPKLSGFFDWGKAKTKQKEDGAKEKAKDEGEAKVTEKEKAKAEREDSKKSVTEVKEKKLSPSAAVTANGKFNEAASRGLKRKSTTPITSDEEVLQSAPRKKSPIAVKGKEKGTVKPLTSKSGTPKPSVTRRQPTLVLISDTSDTEDDGADSSVPAAMGKKKRNVRADKVVLSDSDEDEVRSKWKAKSKACSSAVDKSLQAMMDIDDDNVIKASRPTPTPESELEETEEEIEEEIPPETQTEDLVEDSEPERVAQRPRKKKQQKRSVPVGRNGLKKRRVMRTRTKTDEKGYMVTEDYSSYESVDEEEAEEPVKGKGKGKKGISASTKGKKSADENGKDTADTNAFKKDDSKSAKPAEKPAKARKSISRGGQGSLMNFFGAKTK
ncbi:hypothetical protein DAEQUDRAFT_763831 [Daedalea quercina L-15889]|uniref:DNA polymerase delta subunit 3 n=1 Tax=Daedalea quercina L-15889 TaxID=1314783 RepID=A0A165S765_9APHY|nr:hypothetical protein DAEQUDRAFT_763831 [Daedalea quercina L-15889]